VARIEDRAAESFDGANRAVAIRQRDGETRLSFKQILKRPALRLYLALSRRWPRPSQPAPNPQKIHKVLLLQFGGIGDSLRMIPLIRILGETFPAAELATLTNQSPGLFDLSPEEFPACRHLTFDFGHSLLTKWRRLRELRRERFDLMVLPIVGDGFVEIAILARLIGARYLAGFDLDGGGLCFTHCVPFRRNESLLTQYGRLLTAIGATSVAENITLRQQREAAAAVAARLETHGLAATPLVVVQPWVGGQDEFKAWSTASFRELVVRLISDLDVTVVVVGSPTERAIASKHFAGLKSSRFCNWTGEFTLIETAALLARSRCLVCNDSCLIMIADAFSVPSVAIFGATASEHTLSPTTLCRKVQTDERLPCQPCYIHQTLFAYQCPIDIRCLKTVTVERVLAAVRSVLAGTTR
jgi:lipopolysaccharide heptosyltransferase II